MGHKEAEVAEVKPSQNLPLHSKTALNPYKFRQQKSNQSATTATRNKRSNKSFQPPSHVQENSTQMETMKPRLPELNTDALRRFLIMMLCSGSPFTERTMKQEKGELTNCQTIKEVLFGTRNN